MKIKKGFMKRKIGDKYLVVTTGELSRKTNIFIELNETSSYVWDYVEKGLSEDEIAMKLCKRYSIPKEKALSDVKGVIEAMQNAGVFED